MFSFLWNMLIRSWRATVSAMGTTTLAIAVAFLVIPILLLGIVWFTEGWEEVKRTWRTNIGVVLATLAVWLLIFAYQAFVGVPRSIHTESDAAVAPNTPAVPGPTVAIEKTPVKGAGIPLQSRLEVYNVVGVPATHGSAKGFFFNVFYVNKGNIPVATASHRSIIVSSPTSMDVNEQLKYERYADSVSPPPSSPISEIQPGVAKVPPEHYFSTPDNDKEIANLWSKYQAAMANQQRLYLFVSMKYFDKSLPSDKVRVTEFCGWFIGNFDMWHNCGSNRIYITNR